MSLFAAFVKSTSPRSCTGADGADGPTFIEAERWVDARSFARRLAGGEVDVSGVLPDLEHARQPWPRWEIRYVGHAGGVVPLTMQARKLGAHEDRPWNVWTDVRDLP